MPATSTAILGSGLAAGWKDESPGIGLKWLKPYRRLLQMRTRLEVEGRDFAQAAAQPLESSNLDVAGAATEEFDRDLAWSESSAKQELLNEVNEALLRLEKGTYGVCEMSGKTIPQARLRALPWTRFIREVEQQLELSGEIQRPHLGELTPIAELTPKGFEEPEIAD